MNDYSISGSKSFHQLPAATESVQAYLVHQLPAVTVAMSTYTLHLTGIAGMVLHDQSC
jgi:hypothetical protein